MEQDQRDKVQVQAAERADVADKPWAAGAEGPGAAAGADACGCKGTWGKAKRFPQHQMNPQNSNCRFSS